MLLVIAITFPQGFMGNTAYGATYSNTVTFTEQAFSYYSDGTHQDNNAHGVFKGSLNGNPIFCGDHSKPSPVGETVGNSKTLTMYEYSSKALIDKILYYGYGGPKQWSGFTNSSYYNPYKGGTAAKKQLWMGTAVTSMALTRAYHDGGGYWYNVSGFPEFWSYVNSAAAPPNGFQTYIMYGSGNQQDLFTWIYTPEAYLTLKKSVTEETGKSIAGAEYSVYSNSSLTTKVGTLTTTSSGTTNTLTLKPATYYVKETKAPSGWNLDTKTYTVKLTEDQTFTVNSTESPVKGKLTLKKTVTEKTDDSIAGAEYGVYSNSGLTSKVGTLTTKADGTANTLELLPGTYYVKEIKAPSGWNLDTTKYTVTVNGNATATVTSKETPWKGYAKLTKGISKNDHLVNECPEQYSLAGAKYGVYASRADAQDDYKRIGTLTTKADGTTNTLNLLAGTYYVKEVTAPKGFALDTTIHTLKVENGKTTNLKVEDEPRFDPMTIILKKTDKDGKALAGAEFTIKYYKELVKDVTGLKPERTWVLKTNAAGTIGLHDNYKVSGDDFYINDDGVAVGLIGTYVFTETKAPVGFAAMTEPVIRQVTSGGTTSVTVYNAPTVPNNPQTVSITVQKVDAETGKTVPQEFGSFKGAKYEVTRYNSITNTDEVMGTITLNSKGKGSLKNLEPGVYDVREIKAPDGYLLNPEVITVKAVIKELNTANFDYKVESKETPTEVQVLKYEMINGEKVPLAGATLQILDEEGNVLKEFTTTDEAFIIKGLAVGKYTLREKTTPAGYVTAADVEFEVKEGERVTTVEMEDDIIKVDINKVDMSTKKLMEGVTLQLINSDDQVVCEWTSKEESYRIERLPKGKYILREVSTLPGYVLADDIEIEVLETGDIQIFTMENDHTKIEVYKVDMVTRDFIPGTILSVIPLDDEGNPKVGETFATLMTDENGKINVEYIPAGKYIVRETRPNFEMGYVTAEDLVIEVLDTADVQVFTMEDHHTKVEITKTDIVTGKPLIGAQLSIIPLDENGNPKFGETWATWVTTEDPYYTEYIPVGEYILREISAPFDMGYVTAEDIKFTVEDTGEIQKVLMEDDHTKVEITKTDLVTGEPVIGAILSVIPLDEYGNIKLGETWATWVTTEEPYYTEFLPTGDYILRELITPYEQGYIKAEDIKFTVEDTDEIQKFDMDDDFTKVEISKTDITTGEPVIGAELSIYGYDEKGEPDFEEPLYTWVTEEEPHYIEYIPVGEYILRETLPPYEQGYIKAQDIEFEVLETGEIQRVEMQDDYTKVELLKVDADTGKPLEGAKFELYNEDKEKVAEWTSAKEAHRLDYLPIGTYTLKEVEPPEGYTAVTSEMTFEVKETGEVQSFEVSNKIIPKTGYDNMLPGYVYIAVFSAASYIAIRRRKARDYND